MFLPAVFFAANATIATQFFNDFGGHWTCGNDKYHSQWSIASPDGNYWTIVQYGLDPAHPGGAAYVGWLPQENRYIYNDYHNDGSFAQLTAAPPQSGLWHWTGTYYAAGSGAPDNGPDVTWKRTKDTIVRTFGKREGGQVRAMGADTCTKTP